MLAFIVGIVYWIKSKLIKRGGKHILKSFLSSSNIFYFISVVSLLLITQSSSITVTSRSPREMVRICMVGKQNVVSTFLSFKKNTECTRCIWPRRRHISCPAGWQWGGERGEPECPQLQDGWLLSVPAVPWAKLCGGYQNSCFSGDGERQGTRGQPPQHRQLFTN